MNDRVTQTPEHQLVGRVIAGKYRLLEVLGGGAMGTVYRADMADGQVRAVKVMKPETAHDPALRERFEREAISLMKLHEPTPHDNIIRVFDFGVAPELGLPFLVMELLQGRPLDQMIDETLPDPETGLDVARGAIAGLAHAHARGVLHRDIKTENIFVTWDGTRWVAKLLDFGLVKLDDRYGDTSKKPLTMMGSVFGSPAYMSPEQATGNPLDARSDVYSMGIVLYEVLTGHWPFEAESEIEMFRMHVMEKAPTLVSKREGLVVRPELEAIVQSTLAKEPKDRPPTAVELLRALDGLTRPASSLGAPLPPSVVRAPMGAPMPSAPGAVPAAPDTHVVPSRKTTQRVVLAVGCFFFLIAAVAAIELASLFLR